MREGCANYKEKSISFGETFEDIHHVYKDKGDAEALGIATLSIKYRTVACFYMLSDVLHTVAKPEGSL